MKNFSDPLIFFALSIVTSLSFISQSQANDAQMDTLFDMSLVQLQNIEISTAGKTDERIKDIPASVLIVTRSDIEKYGYTTLTDILENVPGLYNIYSYNGAPGNFGIRGFWNPFSQNSNIAFLVNGVKQINDGSQSNPIDKITVPVEAIDRIEIIKGPMSVIYGSGASFGVINIITNDISQDNDVSLGAISYGSRDTKKAVVRVSQHTRDLNLVFNASEYRANGVDNKFSEMMSPANQAKFPALGVTDPNYNTRGLLDQSNQYIGISGSYKNLYFDTAINNSFIDIYAIAPSLRSGIERETVSTNLLLGYRDSLNTWLSYDAYVNYSSFDRNTLIDFFDADAYGTRKVNYNAWEFELTTAITPNDHWDIIVGINQRTMYNHSNKIDLPPEQGDPENKVTPVFTELSRNNPVTQAIFTQATYSPNDSVTLVAGVRLEKNLTYDYDNSRNPDLPGGQITNQQANENTNTLPRIAAIYHFDARNTLKLLYGEASRIVPDDTNKPENTKTTEINYIYSGSKLFFSTSIFYNQLDNLFQQKTVTLPNGTLIFELSRGDKLDTKGIEILANGYLLKQLFAEVSYTYQTTELESTDSDAPYSPNSVAQGKLLYQQMQNNYSLLGRYVSAIKPEFNVGETVDSYFVFDLNYRRDNMIGNAYLNIKIANIFDEVIRYPNNVQFNTLLDKGTIGFERSIYGTIGWKF